MNTTTIIIIAVIVVIALLLVFLLRSRKQHVTFTETQPLPRSGDRMSAPATPAIDTAEAAPPPLTQGEQHGVATEIADAIEDVVDQFVGIDSHHSEAARAVTGDTLTLLKGLGPKAEALLRDLGVTRFDQIASWNDADVAAIDARMGAFKGRIVRDRWVEQARLLAKGDTAAFESEFGKIGG